MSSETELTHPGPRSCTVSVRYFAGARAATGIAHESVVVTASAPDDAPTVDDLVTTLSQSHGDALKRVLPACSFLVNEVIGKPEHPLSDGATVDVLPPFAGG